jgi:archaellum component FlaC
MQTQTYNVSGNQQVQFYNYNYADGGVPQQRPNDVGGRAGSGNGPGNGANNVAGNGGVQHDDGDTGSRILTGGDKGPLTPAGRYTDLSNRIGVVDRKVDALGGAINGVSSTLNSVQGDVTNIRGKFTAVDRELGQINKKLETLRSQNANSQKDLSEIKTTLGNLAPQIGRIDTEVRGLKDFERTVNQQCSVTSKGSGH